MKKILNVPYISQWDETAKKSKNDCGASSVAMVLNAYGKKVTSDEVFTLTGAGQNYISWDQLRKACDKLDFDTSILRNASKEDIIKHINNGYVPIVVLHYGDLKGRQDTFAGPHILVVTGYDDDGYYVNDPNYWDKRREEGHNKYHLNKDFEKAWGSKVDDNQPNTVFLIWGEIMSEINPDKKLPDSFYEIKEFEIVKELVGAVVGDAFDTILSKVIRFGELWEKKYTEETKLYEDRIKGLNDAHNGQMNIKQGKIKELEGEIISLNARLLESQKNPNVEAGKQVGRVSLLGLASLLIAKYAPQYLGIDITNEDILAIGALLTGLGAYVDKYMHVKGKNTNNEILTKGLTQF